MDTTDEHVVAPKNRIKELREWNLQGKFVVQPELARKVYFTGVGIKEYLNQPHKHYHDKNELITDIENTLQNSLYLGKSAYHKENAKIIASHIFEISICAEKTWLIARENTASVIQFYSISDNENVLRGVEK
jgi:hypothetical protein